jgi:hypothetical protein
MTEQWQNTAGESRALVLLVGYRSRKVMTSVEDARRLVNEMLNHSIPRLL